MLRVTVEVWANGERREIAAVGIQRVGASDDGVATYAVVTSGDGSPNAPLAGLVSHQPGSGCLQLLRTALAESVPSSEAALPPSVRDPLEDLVTLETDRSAAWWQALDENLAALDCTDEERSRLERAMASTCLMGTRSACEEAQRATRDAQREI